VSNVVTVRLSIPTGFSRPQTETRSLTVYCDTLDDVAREVELALGRRWTITKSDDRRHKHGRR